MEQQLTCPNCGTSVAPGQEYCPSCNTPLARSPRVMRQALEAARLRKTLGGSGMWSILWGIMGVITGIILLEASGLNAILIGIGLFLIGTGIAAWAAPSPTTLRLDAAALLAVGIWNIITTVVNGDSEQYAWAIAGIIQIVWSIQRFRKHGDFVRVQHVPKAFANEVERLVTGTQRANVDREESAIAFRANNKLWKGRLLPDMVVAITGTGKAEDVRFVKPDEFGLQVTAEAQSKRWIPAKIRLGYESLTGTVSPVSVTHYETWRAAQEGTVQETAPVKEPPHPVAPPVASSDGTAVVKAAPPQPVKTTPVTSESAPRPAWRKWAIVGMVVALLVCAAGGFVAYRTLGQREFARAEAAYESGDFEEASQALHRVITTYRLSGAPYVDEAQAYWHECETIDRADTLRQQGEYGQAVENYQGYLADAPEGSFAAYVRDGLQETYVQWSEELVEQGKYLDALDALSHAYADYDYSREAVPAAVETAYENALLALARDEGQEGEDTIEASWEAICEGGTATSQAVGLLSATSAKAWYKGRNSPLSADMVASQPGEFRYAVCLEEEQETVQSCRYMPAGVVKRQRITWRILVRDTLTGESIAFRTFTGEDPKACPKSYTFMNNNLTGTIRGAAPDSTAITSWLAEIMGAERPAEEVVLTPRTEAVEEVMYRIGTNAEYPPFESMDDAGAIVGFDADLMDAIAGRAGFTYEFVNTRWDGIFVALQSGEFDAVISAAAITDERAEIVDFSDPYINAGYVIAVRIADKDKIASAADLDGLKVGVLLGTPGELWLSDHTQAEVVRFDQITLAFQALGKGNVDAVFSDLATSADIIRSQPELGATLVGGPVTDDFFGIAVTKENGDLLEMINKGLAAIKSDGTYDEIYEKWFGTPKPEEKPVEFTIHTNWSGDDLIALESVLNDYCAAHPLVTFELITTREQDLIEAVLAAGDTDILLWSGLDIPRWAEDGSIIPLSEYVDVEWTREQFIGPAAETVIYGDQVYGSPVRAMTMAMLYNRALVSSEDVPRTTDELLEQAKVWTKTDWYFIYEPKIYFFSACWFHNGEASFMSRDCEPNLDVPDGVAAAELIAAFREIMPESTDYLVADEMFRNGMAPLTMNGPWAVPNIEKDGVEWGVALLPTLSATGNDPAPYVDPSVWMIASGAQKRGVADAAWSLIKSMSNAESQRALAQQRFMIPTLNAAAQEGWFDGLEGLDVFYEQAAKGVPMPPSKCGPSRWNETNKMLEAIWYGTDPKEVVSSAQKALEEAVRDLD